MNEEQKKSINDYATQRDLLINELKQIRTSIETESPIVASFELRKENAQAEERKAKEELIKIQHEITITKNQEAYRRNIVNLEIDRLVDIRNSLADRASAIPGLLNRLESKIKGLTTNTETLTDSLKGIAETLASNFDVSIKSSELTKQLIFEISKALLNQEAVHKEKMDELYVKENSLNAESFRVNSERSQINVQRNYVMEKIAELNKLHGK